MLHSHLLAWASLPITLSLLFTVECYISPPGSWQPGCNCEIASSVQRETVITWFLYAGRLRATREPRGCFSNFSNFNNSSVQWMIWTYWLSFSCWACVYMALYHWLNTENSGCVSEGGFCLVIIMKGGKALACNDVVFSSVARCSFIFVSVIWQQQKFPCRNESVFFTFMQ